ncbi:MAG TPA: ABC transporter permease [Deinococcales bacterium]|nr:ABC transporter permease [Deinococcales bacterium]
MLTAVSDIWNSRRFRAFRRHRLGLVGLGIVLIFTFAAIFAPYIAPHDPVTQRIATARLVPPGAEHWFGTDELGRDLFSRIVYGARISMRIGLIAEGIALLIGIVLGAAAGYFGGAIDNAIMRVADVFFAIPGLLFLIVVVAIFGSNATVIFLALGLISWPGEARLMRSEVMRVRSQEYVSAAHALGLRNFGIILKHVLPNALASMIVVGSLGVAGAILSEATLSFLGLGIQEPLASWGTMINRGQNYIFNAWWYSVFPGAVIMLVVLGFNFLGDAVRDALALEE